VTVIRKRTFPAVVAILLMLGIVAGTAGCAEDGSDGATSASAVSTTAGPTTTTADLPTLTVQDALGAESGTVAQVVGALIVTYGEADGGAGGAAGQGEPFMILTSALAESYPPQAGGPLMEVVGLDLEDLVGLTSTVGQADVAQATWSDYWLVLPGRIEEGVLEVQGTPDVIRAVTPELRSRFSAVSEPLRSGEVEWFAFDIRNETDTDVVLTFGSGQDGDVVLSQEGAERYRWSEGILFTEAVREITVSPGQSHRVVLNDSLDVPPGMYDLKAWIAATASISGREIQFPALEATVQVY